MTFEELIRSRGFNPKNFHKVVGIDRQSILQYRRGFCSPSVKNAARIANALGVTIEDVAKCFILEKA